MCTCNNGKRRNQERVISTDFVVLALNTLCLSLQLGIVNSKQHFTLLTPYFSGSTGHLHRNNLAPVSMQWAIRNRETSTRATGLRVAGGSNLVFIDSASLRRTTATSAVAGTQEPIIMGTTTS